MHQPVEHQFNPGDYVEVVMAGELDGCEGRIQQIRYTGAAHVAKLRIETQSRKGEYNLPVSLLRKL